MAKILKQNEFQLGNKLHLLRKKVGRDTIFKTEEALSEKIQEYFLYCMPHVDERPCVISMVKELRGRGKTKQERIRPPKRGETANHWIESTEKYVTEQIPLTLSGLALFLEVDRTTLVNYGKKDVFFNTIEQAKNIIHNFAEKSLWEPKITAGIIFNLKNNWHWKDQTEVIDPTKMPTGYEELTDEQLDQELEKLRRENTRGLPGTGKAAA